MNKVLIEIYKRRNSLDLALSSYREVEHARTLLSNEYPTNLEFKKDIAEALNERGKFVLENKKVELYGDAMTALGQANNIMSDLLTNNPNNTNWLFVLSATEVMMVRILEEQKNFEESIVHAVNVIDTYSKINLLSPSENNEHNIWIALSYIAKLYGEELDLDEQLAYYKRSQSIIQSARDKYKTSVILLEDDSVSNLRIGDILQSQGNLDQSFAAYKQAVGSANAAIRQSPADEEASRDLTSAGAALSNLAFAFELKGQFVQALESTDLDLNNSLTSNLSVQMN